MLGTQLDLAYAITALGYHTTNPKPNHQHTLEHILQYLQATVNHQLILRYSTSSSPPLLSYTNANWASYINNYKSTLGYVSILGGSTISWSSKKQATIALSSTKAKYIIRAYATKEAIWLRQLLTKLRQGTSLPTTLHINNRVLWIYKTYWYLLSFPVTGSWQWSFEVGLHSHSRSGGQHPDKGFTPCITKQVYGDYRHMPAQLRGSVRVAA